MNNSIDMRCKLVESGINSSGESMICFSYKLLFSQGPYPKYHKRKNYQRNSRGTLLLCISAFQILEMALNFMEKSKSYVETTIEISPQSNSSLHGSIHDNHLFMR